MFPKLFCSIAPFALSTHRCLSPSLIKKTQGSIFKEFYLKKSMRSIVHSSVWQMCLAASTNFEIFGEILVRYSRRHGLRKDVFQGGPQGDFSKDFLRRAKSGEIWFSHSKLRKQPILLKFSKSRGQLPYRPTPMVVDHIAYEPTSGFFALRALKPQPKIPFQPNVIWETIEPTWLGGFAPFALFCHPITPLFCSPPRGRFRPLWKPLHWRSLD